MTQLQAATTIIYCFTRAPKLAWSTYLQLAHIFLPCLSASSEDQSRYSPKLNGMRVLAAFGKPEKIQAPAWLANEM